MHHALSRALYSAGAKVRNPSVQRHYERLKASEWSSRADLDDLQLSRARDFLTFAGRHSRFYSERFADAGFDPTRMTRLSELEAVPPVMKTHLLQQNRMIHSDGEFPRAIVAETSGTSGQALEFTKDESWDSAVRAHVMRAYDWYGVKVWDRSGYLWGYDIAPGQARKTRLLDTLQNRFRLFSYDKPALRVFAGQLRGAAYLGGYSSMIYEVARLIVDLGLERPDLKLVKGTSEMILDAYQPVAEEAFGQRIVSEYGAAEAGLIAFECPEGSMHINVEDVIVEVDENDEIIVTNLLSRSFPIIRYRLGDVVKLSTEACACGRSHPILEEVVGRRGGTLEGARGRYPALTFYYVFKNLAIQEGVLLNYRAVQDEKGSASIFIEGERTGKIERLVRGELSKYFGEDVDFELRFVSALDRGEGKQQYFESRL